MYQRNLKWGMDGRDMKTLIINGSPRKNGDTMALINEMVKYLNGEVKVVHTYYDAISPCMDCRYCWENDGCSIQDEMQEVYKLLDEVDNVVVASPLYFYELTGSLLSFASRLQCFFVKRCIRKDSSFQLKKKNAVLVITGGGDGSTEPAVNRANIIFRHINAQSIGTVLSLRTNDIPANEDREAMCSARDLASKLNALNKPLYCCGGQNDK
jgi:multimeric flavodoxin WrbA